MFMNRTNPAVLREMLNNQSFLTNNSYVNSSTQALLSKNNVTNSYNKYSPDIYKAENAPGAYSSNNNRVAILNKPVARDYDSYWKKLETQNSAASSRKYNGSLNASQIADKFAKGDNISMEEYKTMLKGIGVGDKYDAVVTKRLQTSQEQNLSSVLKKYNIKLDSNEKINITIDSQKGVIVSGIEDKEKLKKIQDALNSQPNELASLYAISSQTYKKVSSDYCSISQCINLAQQYLDEHTNGKVSVEDLKMQDGKIVGLPSALNNLLNKPVTSYKQNVQSDNKAYEAKLAIVNVLAYIKVNGSDNLPQINSTFTYKGGKLSCTEQPDLVKKHPETTSRSDFNNKTILLQNNPALYYKSVTAHKRN